VSGGEVGHDNPGHKVRQRDSGWASLLKAGRKVVLVERELLGDECAYWQCIPFKTLLWPPECKGEAGN
jgi:hypothetical protein